MVDMLLIYAAQLRTIHSGQLYKLNVSEACCEACSYRLPVNHRASSHAHRTSSKSDGDFLSDV